MPIEELRRRDPKGIYASYDSGKLHNVAGLDLIVDEPQDPDLLFDFNKQHTVREMANKIIDNTIEC
mgnify:FL=1